MPIRYALLYLLAWSLLGLVLMGVDKRRAIRNKRRISEKNLFLISFLGGAAGSAAGMFLFRHKTRHWYFRYGLPVLLLLQLGLIFLLVSKGYFYGSILCSAP